MLTAVYWCCCVCVCADARGEPEGGRVVHHDALRLAADHQARLQYVFFVIHASLLMLRRYGLRVRYSLMTLTRLLVVLLMDCAVNGSKQTLEVPGKNVREIFDDVDFYCSQIETEYEAAGKSID